MLSKTFTEQVDERPYSLCISNFERLFARSIFLHAAVKQNHHIDGVRELLRINQIADLF